MVHYGLKHHLGFQSQREVMKYLSTAFLLLFWWRVFPYFERQFLDPVSVLQNTGKDVCRYRILTVVINEYEEKEECLLPLMMFNFECVDCSMKIVLSNNFYYVSN